MPARQGKSCLEMFVQGSFWFGLGGVSNHMEFLFQMLAHQCTCCTRHFVWLLPEVVKTSHSKWGSIMSNTSFFENTETTATWNPMPIECMIRLIPCTWVFCVLVQKAQSCHLHESFFLSVFSIVHTPSTFNLSKSIFSLVGDFLAVLTFLFGAQLSPKFSRGARLKATQH